MTVEPHSVTVCAAHDNRTVAGFMVGKKAEAGGIAKDGAKMVMAVANVKVGTFIH